MIKKLTPEELNIVTDKITQGVKAVMGDKIRNIILYGSYARGDSDDESDVDIMVLADVTEEEKNKYDVDLCDISSDIGLEHDKLISILIYDKQLFDYHLPAIPFNQNVISDGIELYVN